MKVYRLRLMPSAQIVQEIAQRRSSDGIRCNTCGQGGCPVYLPPHYVNPQSPLVGSESYLDAINFQDRSQGDSVNESIP